MPNITLKEERHSWLSGTTRKPCMTSEQLSDLMIKMHSTMRTEETAWWCLTKSTMPLLNSKKLFHLNLTMGSITSIEDWYTLGWWIIPMLSKISQMDWDTSNQVKPVSKLYSIEATVTDKSSSMLKVLRIWKEHVKQLKMTLQLRIILDYHTSKIKNMIMHLIGSKKL